LRSRATGAAPRRIDAVVMFRGRERQAIALQTVVERSALAAAAVMV